MVPQTVKVGMVDARRVAVEVVICRDVRVGVGVLDVVMVTTESAYPDTKSAPTGLIFLMI